MHNMDSRAAADRASSPLPMVAARYRLLVLGSARMATFPLPASGDLTIGSDEKCEVCLVDPSIAPRHARLSIAGVLVLTHLGGATRRTAVGDRELAPDQATPIAPGTIFTLGVLTAVVQSSGPSTRLRHVRSHAYFEGRLEDELARAESATVQLGIVRIHCAPEHTTRVEEVVADTLRPMDIVASYAPMEYELLLLDATPEAVDRQCERIRARLHALGVTAHVGQACFPRDARSPEQLVAAAGRHLNGAPRESLPAAVPEGAMDRMRPLLERVAATTISVLILGETGAGKEVVCKALHRMSPRASRPLLSINCAALSESLLEAELFGYERGAFTGAVQAKPGLLEIASGGTALLDEVGDMPLAVQAKVLRVLEQKQVTRLGALAPRDIDVRFIAATNRDLENSVERGVFRQDLYFRLNGITLVVPPLRDRVPEIEPLARAFAAQFCEANGRTSVPHLSSLAVTMLQTYVWPGNVRELRNVIERAVLLCVGNVIGCEHLPVDKMGRTLPPAQMVVQTPSTPWLPTSISPVAVTDEERERIERALRECGGNQSRTAQLLGISRRTLIKRIEKYALTRPRKSPR